MPANQLKLARKNRLLPMCFLRPGGKFSGKQLAVQSFLKTVEGIIPKRRRGQHVTAKDSPMPGCIATGSISVLTSDPNKWVQIGNSQCYTSKMKLPLYVIFFGGFDEGDCLIFTDISWSVTAHSSVNGNDAHFSVCSVPASGPACALADDKEPTTTATICALDQATFDQGKVDPSDLGHKDSRDFKHQTRDPGVLHDVSLYVGDSFSTTFSTTTPKNCIVGFGVPEILKIHKVAADLFETSPK
jgi:hypothetical protein